MQMKTWVERVLFLFLLYLNRLHLPVLIPDYSLGPIKSDVYTVAEKSIPQRPQFTPRSQLPTFPEKDLHCMSGKHRTDAVFLFPRMGLIPRESDLFLFFTVD